MDELLIRGISSFFSDVLCRNRMNAFYKVHITAGESNVGGIHFYFNHKKKIYDNMFSVMPEEVTQKGWHGYGQ